MRSASAVTRGRPARDSTARLPDTDAIVKWKVPDGMTGHVYAFEGRGRHVPNLAHVRRADGSRQDERAHGYILGHLLELVPNERVVEVVEFETADPALSDEMTTTITLADADGGPQCSPCRMDCHAS